MSSPYQKHWRGKGSGRSSAADYFNQKRRTLYSIGRNRSGRTKGSWGALGFGNFFSYFKARSLAGLLGKIAGVGAAIIIVFGLAAFAYYSKDIPDPDKLTARVVPESTKIYDRNGELLYDIFGEAKRTLISFEDMPQSVKNATVAIEDKDFYKHAGLDISRIFTSAVKDILTFSRGQGASTITQQFIRNALLTREKSFSRKIKEMVLAIQIERKYTKDEILKLYLNEVPYGNNAYGIQGAATTYFNKNAKDLTLAESAYLAALPQSPTYLSPYGPHRDRLEARKNLVLQLMADQGYISQEEMKAAQEVKVSFSVVRNAIKAPHFVLYVQDKLAETYGEKTLQEGGLQVTTTLDLKLQRDAEEAVAEFGEKNLKSFNASNAALLALDPRTGEILAMVGSRDFFDESNDGQVNVTLRPRQPGSSFKPYVYATAFKKGFSPASMLMDVVTNFGEFGGREYVPQNYNAKTFGPVSMRQALAGSLNIPAVKTILLVGVKDAIATAHDMGITTLEDESRYGPSLVLGGGEVTLYDHVSAFGTFANNGVRKPQISILKVTDARGKVLEETKEKSGQQVIDPQIAYLINSILTDNGARSFVFGGRNFLTLPDRPVAAKTGTTQEFHDAWTIGYVPQLAAGVWVGNNDNSAMKNGADGSAVAAPIWNSFMKKALAEQPVMPFARPTDVRDIAVDSLSGKLPTQYTPQTKPEVFASFAVPQEYDDVHVPVKIDKVTLKPATKETPEGNIYTQVYTILHSEKPDDLLWEVPVRTWAQANGYPYPEGEILGNNDLVFISIAKPAEGAVITSLPMTIAIEASSNLGVKKSTISFDDEEIFSDDTASATVFYAKQKPDGPHTIRVVVESLTGEKTTATRTVQLQTGTKIALSEPQADSIAFFPVALAAVANSSVSSVEFYFRKSGEPARRLAGMVLTSNENGYTTYKTNWQAKDKPEPGTYEVYAESGSGQRTATVNLTIP